MEHVARLSEDLQTLLSALRECGRILLSHMRLRHGEGSAQRTDARFLVRPEELRMATDDTRHHAGAAAEGGEGAADELPFAAICVGEGRRIHAAAADLWNRVARQIVRDNQNGHAIVDDLDGSSSRAVAKALRERYTLQSCLLTEVGAQALETAQQPPPEQAPDVPLNAPPSSLISPAAVERLLRSPLLQSSAAAAGGQCQETLTGAPAIGKATSAGVEFARLRTALAELERSAGPGAGGYQGLADYLTSNRLRSVPRKTFTLKQ
jgi:hypothetical protein